jgi:hypothetical protein
MENNNKNNKYEKKEEISLPLNEIAFGFFMAKKRKNCEIALS